MAQEDRGLVVRGLLLLGGIGVLVSVVLGFLFWRAPAPPATQEPPEVQVPAVVVPPVAAFPSGIAWYAIYQLGQTMPSAPGWEVRYQAATALARRGSSAVPWPTIREMLDEKQQMRNYRVRNADGKDIYDEAAARANMIGALKAIAVWHEKRKAENKLDTPSELRELYPVVTELTSSPFAELKLQAEKAKATFFQ
jgi:hypothetical protein